MFRKFTVKVSFTANVKCDKLPNFLSLTENSHRSLRKTSRCCGFLFGIEIENKFRELWTGFYFKIKTKHLDETMEISATLHVKIYTYHVRSNFHTADRFLHISSTINSCDIIKHITRMPHILMGFLSLPTTKYKFIRNLLQSLCCPCICT